MIQMPFGTNNFAENPEPRLPCILLLDTSGSMAGAPIAELNAGLSIYRESLLADDLASKRVEVSIVTFGGPVQCVLEFTTADSFHTPVLQAGGDTPMGAAIVYAIEMLRQRKESYKTHGISYFRPWIFLITDGAPTDPWEKASLQVREGETSKSLSFFSVGVEGANFETLKQIGVREPLRLKGVQFEKLFLWLSSSQTAVSRSSPGETVPLPNPVTWASV